MEDYIILRVRKNERYKTIERVRGRTTKKRAISAPFTYEKDKVVKMIESGKDFFTGKERGTELIKKEKIHVLPINGEKFIRTDRNETPEDNLGELPEF